MSELPVAPWSFAEHGAPCGKTWYRNLYVSDGHGRRIAAVYGKAGEREKIASAMASLPRLTHLDACVRNIVFNLDQGTERHSVVEILQSLRSALGLKPGERP